MTFVQRLWRSELTVLAALFICAGVIAVYFFAVSVHPASLLSPLDAAWIGFGYTVTFGALLALLYGGPIYALLAHSGRASWPAVLALGLVPGMLALLFEEEWLGSWMLGCGIVIASITHVWMQHWTSGSKACQAMND